MSKKISVEISSILAKFNRSEFDHLDDETFHSTALEIARQLKAKHTRAEPGQQVFLLKLMPSLNKRFLKSVIKNTEFHNQSLSQKPRNPSQTPTAMAGLVREIKPRPIANVSIKKDHLTTVKSSAGHFLSSSYHHLFESSRKRLGECRIDLPPNCPW